MTTRKHASTFPAGGNVSSIVQRYPRRTIAGIVMAVALVVTGVTVFSINRVADQASAAPAPAAMVELSRSGLTPATVTIEAGQSVTWTNSDILSHRLGLVDTGMGVKADGFGGDEPINQGETYSYSFTKPGTYTYTDVENPGRLQGFVIVK